MNHKDQPDLHSYQLQNDPVPTLNWLRENDPVHLSQHGYWFLTRYDDVKAVLGDAKTFSSRSAGFGDSNPLGKTGKGDAGEEKRVSRSLSVSFNQQDAPDHARIRKLVVKAFSRKEINERSERIQEVAQQLLDKVQKQGEFDLVSDFAFHLPMTVAAEIIGIPTEARDRFRLAFEHIERLMAPKQSEEAWQESLAQSRWLGQYVKSLVEQRKEQPENDLISALIEVSEDDEQLDMRELISAIMTIFTAAGTTTERLISTGVYLMLKNPEQLAKLRKDPSLLDATLEELLRYHHPNQATSTNRRATRDVEMRGKLIKAGDTIRVSLGAANRDPAVFEAPDKLLINRKENKHRAFGFGVHSCLGAGLARAEARCALDILLVQNDLTLLTQSPVADPERPDRLEEVRVEFK